MRPEDDPTDMGADRGARRPVDPGGSRSSSGGPTRDAGRAATDPSGMRDAVEGLGTQLAVGWARHRALRVPDGWRGFDGVVVAGMGGSAIGAELAACALEQRLQVPMTVVRDYGLPAWVGRESLVIGSSFSGNTEETLSAWRAAGRRGARRVAVTTGGRLAADARAEGTPVVRLPAGGAPRAALGHSLSAVLAVLAACDLIDRPDDDIDEAVAQMNRLVAASRGTDEDRSPDRTRPDEIAGWLSDGLPFVYAPRRLSAVGMRWKAQINENAKTTAACEVLPELNHNALVGYRHPKGLGDFARVVILDGPNSTARMTQRITLTRELLDAAGIPSRVVRAPGGTERPLVEAMWLVQHGDLTSVHLAARHHEDPTPIPTLDWLKERLADGSEGRRETDT